MSEAIYDRAVQELFQRTYGRLEDRDRIKVLQLFEKSLAEDHSLHVDDLRRLCRNAGYSGSTADDIGRLYDSLYLIRGELKNPRTIDYWRPEIIAEIIGRQNEKSFDSDD